MLEKELIKLAEQIKIKTSHKNYTISTAESCTGGLVAAYLTSIPGSSNYFSTGVVSYSNEAKIKLLNVPEDILTKFGAVSQQAAEYMAIGVQKISSSDIAISVTGIAGPSGGSKAKPVGMVCFGLCAGNKVTSFSYQFSGNRDKIRYFACKQALVMVLDYLKTVN